MPKPSRRAAPAPRSPAAPVSPAKRAPTARAKSAAPAALPAPTRKLPGALAKRAAALHAEAQKRLVQQGREAIALIRERRANIAENYFDIGQALVTLRSDAMALALGYPDVPTLVRAELGLSMSSATKLIELATRVDRSLLRELQQERAAAILSLVDATPEDDTVEQLLERPFPVPHGKPIDLRTAPVTEIQAVAKAIRQDRAAAEPEAHRKGFTTTPADRAAFAALLAPLAKDHALHTATSFKLVASRGKHGALVESRIPLALFRDVLARLHKR